MFRERQEQTTTATAAIRRNILNEIEKCVVFCAVTLHCSVEDFISCGRKSPRLGAGN